MSRAVPILPDGVVDQLFQHARVGISVHDSNGRCLMMNAALAEINGVSASEAIGRTIEEYLPTLAPTLRPHFDTVMATGREVHTELSGETPAQPGRPRWWRATFRLIELGNGPSGVSVVVEEITEQKLAVDALAGSELELRRVFARIDEGFCVAEIMTDEEGRPYDYRFLEVNELFEEMTGLSGARGRTALEMVPDLEHHWIESYARVAIDNETIRFEQGSDAMGRWFDVFATPLATPGRFAIVFRDETARREAQAAERASAEQYRAMADELPLIVWLHGSDGEQQFVNRTFCEFFGVEREQMKRDEWEVLVHPDDADRYVAAFESAVAGRSQFHEHVRVRDGRGEWRSLESWARPRFDGSGAFLGHLGASADVTERVVAEAALGEAMEFQRKVLDSLFSAVALLQTDGTLIGANLAALDTMGLTLDQVRGTKFWDCPWWNVDDDIVGELRRAIDRAAAGEVVRYDALIRVAGDERRWHDVQLVPVRAGDGRVTHLVASGLDITDRVAYEHERSAYLAIERALRHRAELLENHAADLASASVPRDVATHTVKHVEQSLGVRVAAVNLRRDDVIELVAGAAVRPDQPSDQIRLDEHLPGPLAITTNDTIRCGSRREISERFPRLGAAADHYGIESLAAIPLRASDGSALGALVVGAPAAAAFDDDASSLLSALAGQAGPALERALLHERVVAVQRREHEIAVRLQRSLLPDRLVAHSDVSIAARYQAAGDRLEVGGDWYDTFEWPSGQVGLVVGDVVGHDLEAAAAMGRIRAAVAALAPTLPPDPAELLEALQRVVRGRDGAPFVTATCAIIDAADGTLNVASAGHPPPLLIRRTNVEWLRADPAPPLGTLEVTIPSPHRVQLAPGDCVVLYSDGLIERRREQIDVGLDRLRAVCADTSTDDIDALLDRVLHDLADDTVTDDIVIAAMRWRSAR